MIDLIDLGENTHPLNPHQKVAVEPGKESPFEDIRNTYNLYQCRR